MFRTSGALARLVLTTTAVAAVLVGAGSGTANAVGTGAPVINDPTASTYRVGSAVPVSVNLSDVPAGDYNISVTEQSAGGSRILDETVHVDDTTPSTFSYTVYPVQSGVHAVEVDTAGQADALATRSFTAIAKKTTLTHSARPSTFYPYVKDGYRDTTVVGYRVYGRVRTQALVYGPNGLVRSVDLGFKGDSSEWASDGMDYSWAWNGRNNAGSLVPSGKSYSIVIKTTETVNGQPYASQVSSSATVARGYRTLSVSKSRDGYDNSSQARSGCDIHRAYWTDSDLFLDCWGGDYALARYAFAIPANATNLRWSVNGAAHCCSSPGVTRKTFSRPNPRTAVVQVKVTGWHSYQINRVNLSYTYRKAI